MLPNVGHNREREVEEFQVYLVEVLSVIAIPMHELMSYRRFPSNGQSLASHFYFVISCRETTPQKQQKVFYQFLVCFDLVVLSKD